MKKLFLAIVILTAVGVYGYYHPQLNLPKAQEPVDHPINLYAQHVTGAIHLFETGDYLKANEELIQFKKLGTPFPKSEGAEDPETEYLVFKGAVECYLRNNGPAKKTWDTLESAKISILFNLTNKTLSQLEDYVACDAVDYGALEVYWWGNDHFTQPLGPLSEELSAKALNSRWAEPVPAPGLWQAHHYLETIDAKSPCPIFSIGNFRNKFALSGMRTKIQDCDSGF